MSTSRPDKGLLLINLGTPDEPTPEAVRRYLREFLWDERVLDLHPVPRWLLLNLIILPRRPRASAEAYRKIWTEQGSPLLHHSRSLLREVARELDGQYRVELAMRYGNPSLHQAVLALKAAGVRELTVLPLYPQNADSTTASSVVRLKELVQRECPELPVKVIPPFFNHGGFLDAFAEVARPVLAGARADHVLFSFHGLPERHVRKADPSGAHCLAAATCCETLHATNGGCYRAQAYFTAKALAGRLALPEGQYSVTFQSRLGRTEWIKPYTDATLTELARRGVKRLAVVCPAFVADCLETLEEIGLRAREQFVAEGGEELVLVPSLNASPGWVRTVAELVRQGAGAAP